MSRLPKNRGIIQAEEDKSLILRHVLTCLEPVPNLVKLVWRIRIAAECARLEHA